METAQELFDTVVAHLRAQNARSVDEYNICALRGQNGTKCPIGHLIPDELYNRDFEGISLATLLNDKVYLFPEELCVRFNPHRDLLIALQRVHDRQFVVAWEVAFQEVAARFNLNYQPPA